MNIELKKYADAMSLLHRAWCRVTDESARDVLAHALSHVYRDALPLAAVALFDRCAQLSCGRAKRAD